MENEPAATAAIGLGQTREVGEMAFSRAVSIEENNQNILIFSTVDRQFAVVKKGDKVTVKVFRYPMWDFEKGGTYYGGRLLSRKTN